MDDPWSETQRFDLDGQTGSLVYSTGLRRNLVLEESVNGEAAFAHTYVVRGGDQLDSKFVISVEHDRDVVGYSMQVDMGEGGLIFTMGECR